MSEKPDFSSLVTSLNQSNLQKTNYAAYQTILFLIKNTLRFANLTQQDIDTINEDVSTIFAASFLTVNNESNDFVNSRQLLAGTGITFDDSVANERTVSSTGGSGNDHVPMSTGAEPLEIMSDGAGHVFLVGFTGP